ncbi:hypothetical protein CLV31_109140 [Algoriphagus aquaeductus]|uniref:Uncharacterized protein n=1 Tax=Algoriphagus aquaeductus TaxID=475299 RepID=A0A326RZJ2_9BACT|nr:hypothetical protein CLV31_109140 [Algoriphagus aquaeductus]
MLHVLSNLKYFDDLNPPSPLRKEEFAKIQHQTFKSFACVQDCGYSLSFNSKFNP